MDKLPAQTLLVLFSEFIVAATKHYSMIFVLIRDKLWWDTYSRHALHTADQILRTRFLNHNFSANVPSPIVQRPKPSLFEFSTVWPLLIKAFEINTSKPETLEAAGPLGSLPKKWAAKQSLGPGLSKRPQSSRYSA